MSSMTNRHLSRHSEPQNDLFSGILYGLINSIMVIPVSVSFCSIIFRDPAFILYLPMLVKLVLFSSAIHQICFSMFSSLPFAVGQVQDAGLIFLSAMAGSIASSCKEAEDIVPTTLYVLAICTFLLGCMLIVVSKLKLASMVQYLPMPVVGGYLAFIGFFCGEAGLAMMAGVTIENIMEIGKLGDPQAMVLFFPGLIIGISIYVLLRKFRSPLVLPFSLLVILVSFYSIMWLANISFEDARSQGWIAPLTEQGSSFEAWGLYDASKVEWHNLPRQIFRLIGMFFVVAFSSSLDVAAIEMELGIPLDYNNELLTVGISNTVSGLFGGYTGSYIFSQTIFTMRRGVNTRICGFLVAVLEIVVVFLPISITAYIPKMFFGSLLVLIATDLMFEWLIAARHKMMLSEYAVCLITFLSIQFLGIELGMLVGIISAMFSFVVTYSKLQSVSEVTLKSSTVIRTFEERSVLLANRGKVVTISFGGYIFFGSAVKVLEEIKSKLVLESSDKELNESDPYTNTLLSSSEDYLQDSSSVKMSHDHQKVVRYSELIPTTILQSSSYTFPSFEVTSRMTKSASDNNGYYQIINMNPSDEESPIASTGSNYGSNPSLAANSPLKLVFHASSPPTSSFLQSKIDAEEAAKETSSITVPHKNSDEFHQFVDIEMAPKSSNDSLSSSQHKNPTESYQTQSSNLDDSKHSDTSKESKSIAQSSSLLHLVLEGQSNRREKLRLSLNSDMIDSKTGSPKETVKKDNSVKKKVSESTPHSQIPMKQISIPLNPISTVNTSKPQEGVLFPRLMSSASVKSDVEVVTEYLVLDFTGVLGLDATAARSCFLTLVHLMKSANVTVVFANMSVFIEELLVSHRVIENGSIVIPNLDDALEWCEDQVLLKCTDKHFDMVRNSFDRSKLKSFDHQQYAKAWRRRQQQSQLRSPKAAQLSSPDLYCSDFDSNDSLRGRFSSSNIQSSDYVALAQPLQTILEDYLEIERGKPNSRISSLLQAQLLIKYFQRVTYLPYELIFDIDDRASSVYFIESGNVEIVTISPSCLDKARALVNEVDSPTPVTPMTPRSKQMSCPGTPTQQLNVNNNSSNTHQVMRVNKVSSGGIFGEADFFIGRKHSLRAYSINECVCWVLDREKFAAMEVSDPQLCMLIQYTLLKSLSIASTCAMYTLHPTTAYTSEEV